MFHLDAAEVADLLNDLGLRQLGGRNKGRRFTADAGETAAFLRQLTYIFTKTFDKKYPELKARTFIPVNHEIPAGNESFVWRSWDLGGMAKIVSNFADDLPTVSVIAAEVTQGIKSFGDAYDYSLQDMKAAALTGNQLDVKKAFAARRVMENLVEQTAAFGNAGAGLPGFINNGNVPLLSAPGSLTGNWPTATAVQMYDDLNAMANAMVVNTLEIFVPDTIILPTNRFSIVATKGMSDIDTTTVLRRFLENSPYIRNVDQWGLLNNANATNNGPRAIVYKRDPEIVELMIPEEFTQLPPQARNLAFVILCTMRFAGVSVYYPLGMEYVDGL